MQSNRSPWWALGGAGFGFLLPFVGFACIAMVCVASMAGMGMLNGPVAASSAASHISGPLSGPAVAVIDIRGEIVSGPAASLGISSVTSSDDIVPLVHQAAEDVDVRAILLRIDSPGGSVVASDQIYHALKGTGKPIVVLMGELAASGGYYVSMAAQYLIANPATLTGSIGVISSFPEASELMRNLGVTVSVIKSGEVKDIGSLYRPMTDEEKAEWQKIVNEIYENFVRIVAEGRRMALADVRKLADGSIYTGTQALELGLIDALGYQEDAVAKAAELGGIAGVPRVFLLAPPAESLVSSLLSGRFLTNLSLENYLTDLLAPKLEYRWTGN